MLIGELADLMIAILEQGLESFPVRVKYYDSTGKCRAGGEIVDLRFGEEQDEVVLEIREETGLVVDDVLADAFVRCGELSRKRIVHPGDPMIEKELV